ncbi:MAG: hypothetical protein PHP25_02960 [Candidatus Moranbacteria bacterium]|nr:hypothetical protein [Candidatus Moranbacteria bacterium]
MDQTQKENKTEEIRLDGKSKILFVILGILVVGSVAVTYWRYMMKRDYIIQAQIDCDPETENCFIWKCDPNSLVEGEKCTGVPDNDIWYYKILSRNAKNIPDCDPNDENCAAYVCGEGEADCSEELCTAENVPDGEECNDPAKYLLENPPEEEAVECAPDDEECLNAQSAECPARNATPSDAGGDPETEDCSAQSDAECAAGDETCAATSEGDSTETGNVPAGNSEDNSDANLKNIPPPVVQPN